MSGKFIVIEGTDCSGKETQSKLLIEKLKDEGKKAIYLSYPNYSSPTGKIVGGPYLGKEEICDSYFDDAANLDPKIASLYYAADRYNNKGEIQKYIDEGYYVILDRYVFSNMAHQAGKINEKEKRIETYKWLDDLEFGLLSLMKPDIILFLHMPSCFSEKLKGNRKFLDELEKDKNNLINAEKAYLELKDIYGFKVISCVKDNKLRKIEDINKDVFNLIKEI